MSIESLENSESSKRKPGHEVIFSRHSKAKYLADDAILVSDNPLASVDPENQPTPDLSPEGVELAKKSAEKFFAKMDKEKDKIFLVSSNKARALETAAIYRDVAKEKGFTIIQSEHPGDRFSKKPLWAKIDKGIGEGDIRVLHNLSLLPAKALSDAMFYPDNQMPKINWNAVSLEDKEHLERLHAIIMSDNKGSWGANFHAHATKVKALFPQFEIKDKEILHNKQFKKLVRLVEWGIEKAGELDPNGSVKILAFGHENYLGLALNKYFNDHEIKNCEAVAFTPDVEGGLVIERRGEFKNLNE